MKKWLLSFLLLTGCAETQFLAQMAKDVQPESHHPRLDTPGGVQGYFKVGDPYQIKGTWYYPEEDYGYSETGIASWYGPGFHGNLTANGEVYDEMALSAAHRTLPMPSLVRVTNLDNGRSLIVRVNDRGPFARGRIIDLSRRAAQLLGFEQQGTAKVRVEILSDESRAIASAARRGEQSVELSMAKHQALVKNQPGSQKLPPMPARALVDESQIMAERGLSGRVAGQMRNGMFMPSPVVQQAALRGTANIYVQAGAFTIPGNAKQVQRVLSRFTQADISEAIVKGRKFYRVRVGPLSSAEQADAMLDRVINAGSLGAKIIVE